jgi:hypothetical protein
MMARGNEAESNIAGQRTVDIVKLFPVSRINLSSKHQRFRVSSSRCTTSECIQFVMKQEEYKASTPYDEVSRDDESQQKPDHH